jgi:cellulose synthase/poly-beta-1,6-N-acetylglucosamine synthase-like glycosyltransferase
VVDDHSTDGTFELVKDFPAGDMKLSCIRLPQDSKSKSFKKLGIETGIGSARGDWIVTTDADCIPQPDWLITLAIFQKKTGAKFIAAPVKIIGGTSLVSIFQTLDFITLQGVTGASVYRKFHTMCNGANLAYEKKTFEEVDGYRGIDSIPSGDDMLLMHKIFKKYPDLVFYLKSRKAIISTQAEQSWKSFLNQRIRWASKADQYDDRRIFWSLFLVYLVNLQFPVILVFAIWQPFALAWFAFLLLMKIMVEYPFVRASARFFGQEHLMRYFPWLQPLHILYMIAAGWLGKFGSYNWKGRKIGK